MTYFWFLIFLLKVNEITLSELFNIKDCKKGKGWKWRRKLFIRQTIVNDIKVHILASPTFWHGQAMSRNTVPPNSKVSYPWFCLVQVLWSQQWDGMQGGAILRRQGAKRIFSDDCACQHLWILLIEGPLTEISACLRSGTRGGFALPLLSQNWLSGCRWVSRLPS